MPPKYSKSPDIDESIPDTSTAPTTPDDSLTFSPVLQALSLDDGITLENSPMDEISAHYVENVCIVGAGYVGGPTAAILALQNPCIKIIVVDKDSSRIKQWNSKHLPIHEPGLSEIIRICRDGSKAFSFFDNSSEDVEPLFRELSEQNPHIHIPARSPNLFFSEDIEMGLREANLIMVAVNTPTKTYGIGAGKATDMTAVISAVQDIGKYAKAGAIIVEKSTVPGRTGEFIKNTLAIHRPHINFPILSSPEFLSAGTAIRDLLYPDRILIGSSPGSDSAANSLASLYHWLPSSKIIHTSTYSSELAKLVSNAMLAQRIGSINSISAICECIDADINEVATAVGMDSRIGDKYLKAGIGFGGSCFGKDIKSLMFLAEELGLQEVVRYWESVLAVNEWQKRRWVEGIVRALGGGLTGKKMVVLGYAFKRGTGDVRESLAGEVVRMLVEERPRCIVAWDDGCEGEILREEISGVEGAIAEEDLYTACEEADALLICRELETSSTDANSKLEDPRPFLTHPSEIDLLNLRNYLSSKSQSNLDRYDPIGRLYPEPTCEKEENCPKCKHEHKTEIRIHAKETQTIDWKEIITGMKAPRWIFDGRGVLDRNEIEKIGKDVGVEVRIVEVGKLARI
ncbi:2a2b7f15-36fd-4ca9-bf0c-66fb039223ec [Sclerotinia trifoliorum]|uniref:UDP-glucose 6-dehydrogenase n=1 Tax=Sclerotinia trifoliorum TaxID=28548 RepID=A0A8H2W3E4_9HELO|nr:2a2b7f15-36fd-4ca9-bf0c-66fb039223ec [Sclerotinia trifoliorum]